MSLEIINPTDSAFTANRYILSFGTYGCTNLLVWADHLQDALDECIDWLVDNAPGLLCDDAVNEAYQEAIDLGETEERAQEIAEEDTTAGGNCGNHIMSDEWALHSENPNRATIKALQAN